MKEENYILYEDYLSGTMSEDEVQNFEKKLASDSEFKKAFDIYKELSGFLAHDLSESNNKQDFMSNLESISTNHFSTEKEEMPLKKSKTFRIGQLAIAATIILFLGLFIFNKWSTPGYSDYSDHEVISLSVRGIEDMTGTKAQNAFNNKKFAEAEEYFNTLLKTNPNNVEVRLYKAISQIEQDKFAEAESILQQIITGTSAYKNQAIWYAALSKLKQKDYKASITYLKRLPSESIYYEKAQKLIDKLD